MDLYNAQLKLTDAIKNVMLLSDFNINVIKQKLQICQKELTNQINAGLKRSTDLMPVCKLKAGATSLKNAGKKKEKD